MKLICAFEEHYKNIYEKVEKNREKVENEDLPYRILFEKFLLQLQMSLKLKLQKIFQVMMEHIRNHSLFTIDGAANVAVASNEAPSALMAGQPFKVTAD